MDAELLLLHAHAGIVQQLPIVRQYLDGDTQFHGHHPRIAFVYLLHHAIVHGTDQRQRGLPATPALALQPVLATTAWIVVFRVDELMAQRATALALVEPVGQQNEFVSIVV